MKSNKTRCLILACGNTLRGDDGIGPWLAQWAEERFDDEPGVRVLSRQQWTLELAEEISTAETVLFVDCSATDGPGSVSIVAVQPAAVGSLATHHQGAPELLGLAGKLYASLPRTALLMTVGAGSIELSEEFSQPVLDAIPLACTKLEEAVMQLLARA
ncbi:MAG TPA: hydrogenase maturation protease [Terracidiphilus sp.]|jgi:hydrogenase maturation protease|nr:hydrogenase maturation protease [Terracidiphilus sp.]